MKKVIYSLICLVVLASNAFTGREAAGIPALSGDSKPEEHGGVIETRYDGFKYETVVTLKRMRIVCGFSRTQPSNLNDTCVSIVASLHCPGAQLDYVRYAHLQLIFEAKDWQARHPLGQRDLIAVADGETLKLGTMQLGVQDIDSDRGLEYMKEVLEVSIPYQTFTKLAKAQFVEMKVGRSIFGLKEKNLWALRDLNNRVNLKGKQGPD